MPCPPGQRVGARQDSSGVYNKHGERPRDLSSSIVDDCITKVALEIAKCKYIYAEIYTFPW